MFTYAHTFIDTVQSVKINTLKTLVADEKVREPFQAIIDEETEFVKSMADIADDFYSKISKFNYK